MATISYYTLDESQLTRVGNNLLEVLEGALVRDGVVQPGAITENYVVVHVQRGMLTKFFDRVFMRDVQEGHGVYTVLRVSKIDENKS